VLTAAGADEGLVTITKGYENKRPRTWASLTDDGYVALTAEMSVLKELLAQFENGGPRAH